MSMSTDFATRDQVEEYVARHKLRNVLQVIFSEIVLHLPENPVMYMMDSLRNKLFITPDMPIRPKRVTVYKNGSRRNGQVCLITDSKATFLAKVGSLLGIKAKRLFNVRGAEYSEIELIDSEETIFVSAGEAFADPNAVASVEMQIQVITTELVPLKFDDISPEPETVSVGAPKLEPGFILGAVLDRFPGALEKLRDASRLSGLKYVDINSIMDAFNRHGSRSVSPENLSRILGELVAVSGVEPSSPDYLALTFVPQLYALFDPERSNLIDFSEPAAGLSVLCKGSREDHLQFIGQLCDSEQCVDREEWSTMFAAIERTIHEFAGVPGWGEQSLQSAKDVAASAFAGGQDKLPYEEFVGYLASSAQLDAAWSLLASIGEYHERNEEGGTEFDAESRGHSNPDPYSDE